jgi:hypothetical protein
LRREKFPDDNLLHDLEFLTSPQSESIAFFVFNSVRCDFLIHLAEAIRWGPSVGRDCFSGIDEKEIPGKREGRTTSASLIQPMLDAAACVWVLLTHDERHDRVVQSKDVSDDGYQHDADDQPYPPVFVQFPVA